MKPGAENLIRDMLQHPEISIDPDYIMPLTRAYGPGRIFFTCCRYLEDRRSGSIESPGALIHRLANPNQFPAPKPCPSDYGDSRFYSDFITEVHDYRDKINRLEWEREESEVNSCNDNDQTPNTNGAVPPLPIKHRPLRPTTQTASGQTSCASSSYNCRKPHLKHGYAIHQSSTTHKTSL